MLKTRIIIRFKQKRLTFFIKFVGLLSLLFVIYQFIIAGELGNELISREPEDPNSVEIIRGTHEKQARFYENRNGTFSCITSMETIDYHKVNDDYCDCLDGTDEPGTNACPNGIFYCKNQTTPHNYPKVISASKVNDGIYDCYDGSDEWKKNMKDKRKLKIDSERMSQEQYNNLCCHQTEQSFISLLLIIFIQILFL